MKSSDSIANLAESLVRANLVILNPTKDRTARMGSYSYRYVGLDSLTADMRPILQAHGLAVVQEASTEGVTTRILHSSGEWLEFDPLLIPGDGDAQSIGSAITYARRYALCAALGIAGDDDDDGAKAKTSKKSSAGAVQRPASADPPAEAHTGEESSTTTSTAGATSGGGQTFGEGVSPPSVESPEEAGVGGTDDTPASSVEPSQETHVHGDWTPAPRAGFVICGRERNGRACGYAEKKAVAAHA